MTILNTTVRYVSIFVISMTLSQTQSFPAEINAMLRVTVIGSGFHRTLVYNVNMYNLLPEKCHIAVHLELPSALFVNADELADLRRAAASTACSVGETNVEAFTEKGYSQNITLCAPLNQNSCQLAVPIHQRYHYAGEGGGYAKVTLPRPKLLLGCKDRIREYRVSKVNLCSPCVDFVSKWREVPYTIDGNTCAEWQVPIGDSNLQAYVTYATLLVTVFGTLFVVRAISQVTMEDRMKRD